MVEEKVTFKDCILGCIRNKEFLGTYDKLRNTRLSSLTGIEAMIDKATGKQEKDLGEFLLFVYNDVWMRIPKEAREE